jgi:polyphosphate kinase
MTQPEQNFSNAENFINRELSLLQFQRRVLEEAKDLNNPLLERMKFLAIVGSNMDEFFMVRVASLKQMQSEGVGELSADGLTATEQLSKIRKEAHAILSEAAYLLEHDIRPKLWQAGVHLCDYAQLTPRQQEIARKYYEQLVFPVLTPLAVDPSRPFPHISNMSLNLATLIRDQNGQEHFARVKVPDTLPRFIPIKHHHTRKDGHETQVFVWLEQVIAANAQDMFPGMEVVEVHPFRVIRDAEMVIREQEAGDLLQMMEASVWQRQFGSVVEVVINPNMPSHIREILSANLGLQPSDLYEIQGPFGTSSLMSLYGKIDRPDLKDVPHVAVQPQVFRRTSYSGDIFGAIRAGDILMHLPYESFDPVVEFLNKAATDPQVLAIKQTLYRAGRNSPVVQALLRARENGKQVAVLVELKARFDEESNIEWARQLEHEGVHVTYGLLGLKTHCKVALVVRRENDTIRRYVHLGTGNYNASTARIYEDFGLFTCDESIGADVTDLFNFLTGFSNKRDYHKLVVAPLMMRTRLEDLIEREIEHARQGRPAYIIFKLNALVDSEMVEKLYKASQAGVKIDLIVRGMCCLRPGVRGVSENIRVRSILGRFLEHSRIYYFQNNGEEEVYLGSADLMTRNLDRRVETIFPIESPELRSYLRDEVLNIYLADTVRARSLQPDGSYVRIQPQANQEGFDSQNWFLRQALL